MAMVCHAPPLKGEGTLPPRGEGMGALQNLNRFVVYLVPPPFKYIADAFLLQLHRDEIQCHET